MNEIAMISSALVIRLRAGLVYHSVQIIQQLSRIKTLNGPKVRRISPVGEEKRICQRATLYMSSIMTSKLPLYYGYRLLLTSVCVLSVFMVR